MAVASAGLHASLHLIPDNHANIPPLNFLQAGCPSCHPTNSIKALKGSTLHISTKKIQRALKQMCVYILLQKVHGNNLTVLCVCVCVCMCVCVLQAQEPIPDSRRSDTRSRTSWSGVGWQICSCRWEFRSAPLQLRLPV